MRAERTTRRLGAVLALGAIIAAGCGASPRGGAARAPAHDGHAAHAGHATPTTTAAASSDEADERAFAALHGKVRVHYIAADPVAWDYAPSGKNLVTGKPLGEPEATWDERGPTTIGHVYMKSIYREYTDATFTKLAPVAPEWQHLGDLGPVLHAEVGDTLKIVFRNNTPFPASMHAHGVYYEKDSEGAPYDDGTSGADKADDSVATGGTHTYVWQVRERSGPGPADPSSIMWMYHSHSDEGPDVYAGLMGAIIVTRKGMARADGSPRDVDRELVVNFEVDDENDSPWIDTNIQKYTLDPSAVDKQSDEFHESNLMHSINGYDFGNLPGLTMKRGQRVRWYVMGMGTEVDLHTPHWHGNDVTSMGMRVDVVNLLPASMVVADMRPDNQGTWLFHCHVNDHLVAGMEALYKVT
ncbi:MAG TPA: multicopper oxidase domain-containing protein [Acidimicrobiia bacterium]|nr:multicopper oxidase domain-containing protein [Acidimicrobiia bacterium]